MEAALCHGAHSLSHCLRTNAPDDKAFLAIPLSRLGSRRRIEALVPVSTAMQLVVGITSH